MSEDGRKYKRIKNDFNVRVIVPDPDSGRNGIVTGKARNVSAAGVLFFNERALDIGTIVNVKFLRPNSFDFFQGDAKVVRVEIPESARGYEIGIQFIELSEDDEKKLNYYLSQE